MEGIGPRNNIYRSLTLVPFFGIKKYQSQLILKKKLLVALMGIYKDDIWTKDPQYHM